MLLEQFAEPGGDNTEIISPIKSVAGELTGCVLTSWNILEVATNDWQESMQQFNLSDVYIRVFWLITEHIRLQMQEQLI